MSYKENVEGDYYDLIGNMYDYKFISAKYQYGLQ